jgi:hypothetical protein
MLDEWALTERELMSLEELLEDVDKEVCGPIDETALAESNARSAMCRIDPVRVRI